MTVMPVSWVIVGILVGGQCLKRWRWECRGVARYGCR